MTPEDLQQRGAYYLQAANFLFESGDEKNKTEAWDNVKVGTLLVVAGIICGHLIDLKKGSGEVAD